MSVNQIEDSIVLGDTQRMTVDSRVPDAGTVGGWVSDPFPKNSVIGAENAKSSLEFRAFANTSIEEYRAGLDRHRRRLLAR